MRLKKIRTFQQGEDMSDEIKKVEEEVPKAQPPAELPEAALDQVVGGKVSVQDFNFVKKIDKSSANLM